MTALIITIHVIVSIALILIVLLQTGKGADMGAVFGGAGSQALFGQSGAATFLGKMTTAAAVIFMITSLTLAYISKSGGKSVVADIKPASQQAQPAVPVVQPDPLPELGETDSSTPEKQEIPVTTEADTDTTKAVESLDEESPVSTETPVTEIPVTTE